MSRFNTEGANSSPLGYGFMGFGKPEGPTFSGELLEAARNAFEAAYEVVGIRVFDLADIYNQGRSESILGALLAKQKGLWQWRSERARFLRGIAPGIGKGSS